MKLIVSPHKIEIDRTPVNEKEINVTKVKFEFSDEITESYTKEAYFTLDGESYKVILSNNECDIPGEVLEHKGQLEIGCVAFLVENEEEIKRYNPSPVFVSTLDGSLKEAENIEPITPSDKEQIEQSITNLQNNFDNYYSKTENDSLLDAKEDISNKTTSITSDSTDTEYPSAKAVYSYANGIIDSIGEAIDVINGEVI